MAVRSTKSANAKPFINPVTYYVTGFFLCHNFALLFPVYGSQGTHIMKKTG
ncbi:CDP-diacylglycerol diphosphatase, partial [Salmonella enterica subsp. enterica serovar Virchow]|nr:CDP-diacylglycerol diphosphatase [Salmonella enterica subsp. enterica serovar Typhimurium]ECP4934036.1 CDP-diacylglycerol diphosphatase [Salmonella enterica subsp. enterica serovar Virchow]